MGASKLVTAKNDTAAKESAEALLQKQVNLKISTLSSKFEQKVFSLPLEILCPLIIVTPQIVTFL